MPSSRVPASAERRTSEASSCGVRAPDSSSCGVMPTVRSTRLAEPLSTMISGRARTEKTRTGSATTWAVAQRGGDAEELGQQLAEDHREDGREDQRQGARRRPRPHRLRSPSRVSGPLSSRPDGRLGEVADDERRQGDADLRGGELGRELRAATASTGSARWSPSSTARWTWAGPAPRRRTRRPRRPPCRPSAPRRAGPVTTPS